MKIIEVDLKNIRQNGIIVDLNNGFKIDFIYNHYDNFIYLSVLDNLENRITGFNKLVPNVNYLGFNNNNYKEQLRCIKVNEFAEEKDYITPENINKDYKFFLIGGENETI
ncbi:MAG: hypothetical protein SOY60_06975 [Fusobacterium gastrosuis]|uniref:phage baseplate plug family protein n=1 Tax=Fusobacterium gastrosuis TaxID=1755100 RepID=UPI002A8B309C|nr:hypothetical protein [Fusobacterium gastrosuis]